MLETHQPPLGPSLALARRKMLFSACHPHCPGSPEGSLLCIPSGTLALQPLQPDSTHLPLRIASDRAPHSSDPTCSSGSSTYNTTILTPLTWFMDCLPIFKLRYNLHTE